MRTIIAGSRGITDYEEVRKAIIDSGFIITEVVSGACPTGVDPLGERWAYLNDIPVKRFPADWDKFGKGAGPIRNREMARYGEALIACWDGVSRGTLNMVQEARLKGLKVHLHTVGKVSQEFDIL
jgi:hypothetical protein